jgi:signal peptidase I
MEKLNESPKVSRVRHGFGVTIAIILMVILLQFAVGNVQSYVVISRSMDPTLKVGDRVLLLHEFPSEDLHGKVIAFEPDEPGSALTKRVLAQGGERVELKNGTLYVNGQPDRHGKEPLEVRWHKSWKVGKNQMFVAGDNRNNSYDSVDHGPVNTSKLLGVLAFRYWPPDRVGAVN